MADPATIEAYYLEERTFPPSEEFKKDALVVDNSMHEEAETDFEGFWARQAAELLDWDSEWDTVLEWELPFAKMVRRRHAERLRQLRRPPRGRRQGREGRLPLGG